MGSNISHQQEQRLIIQQYESTARKRRILIVNHEDDVSFALKLVLEEEEGQIGAKKRNYFQVDYINDPVLALNDFQKGSYDLVLIAIVMPRMNGFQLSKAIKKIDDKVKICFLIAGEIPNKVRFDASSTYLDRFIKLPIENKDLIEQINRIIIHS